MGIPKKALRESVFIKKKRLGEGSHETYLVEWGDPAQKGFFKKLDHTYPELLAKISVAVSSLKRSAHGKKSAQEMLVFDDEDNIVGTVSVAVEGFNTLNFQSDPVPSSPEQRMKVIPNTEFLIEANVIENIFSDWFLGNNDAHPHNIGYVDAQEEKSGYFCNIDFDMYLYEITAYLKGGPRPTLSNPEPEVDLSPDDFNNFPLVCSPIFFHWYTHTTPGKNNWPSILPEILQDPILANAFTKTYADPTQFAALAADPRAHEQKFTAALKTLLSFQPKVQRQRFTQLFGELTLNYKSLTPAVRGQYEKFFPQFFNDISNEQSFVDFMMKLYQERYDRLYRLVVFNMGCEKNKSGVPLFATNLALYKKPSYYQQIREWVIDENKTMYNEPEVQFDLDDLLKRYHQVFRDSLQPRLENLRRATFTLLSKVRQLATISGKGSETPRKSVADTSLTSSWQLFSDMPDFSIKDEEMGLDKDNHLRDAHKLLNKFAKRLEEIKNKYYEKKMTDLEPQDGHHFSKSLYDLCNDDDNPLISKYLGHGVYDDEFLEIIDGLGELERQANFMRHLSSTDERMQKMSGYVEKAPLSYAHPIEINNFCTCLFSWIKNLPLEEFNRYVDGVIGKYSNTYTAAFYRQRAEPVRKYLKESSEPNDRKLAYIFTSGSKAEGALNRQLIEDLTTRLMLTQYYLPSISRAFKDVTVKETALKTLTQAAVDFARVNPDFIHLCSLRGCELFYEGLYEWIGTISKKELNQIIDVALQEYGNTKWSLSLWGASLGTPSRVGEIKGYLAQFEAKKAVALTFLGGEHSTASKCILLAMINNIKKEPKCEGEPPGYQLIRQFTEKEHMSFYMEHMKNDVTKSMTHLQTPQLAAAAF